MSQENKIAEERNFLNYIVHKDYYRNLKQELRKYIQHGDTTIFDHSKRVAFSSYKASKALERRFHVKMDYESLVCACYMHDFFGYDWHEKSKDHRLHGFTHPVTAAKNADLYCKATQKEQDIIKSHMWPLTITRLPKSKEAWILCVCDKCVTLAEVFH